MHGSYKQRRDAKKQSATLFGQAIADPLAHLSAQYPFPARLNEHHIRKFKASNVGILHSKGAILFEDGDQPTGVYVILDGCVKLSLNSADGRTLLLGFFGPGTILGLGAAILERSHVGSAEVLRPTKAAFVPRKELAREIQGDTGAARKAAELVSEDYYFILSKMRAVDLSQSARQKLARCLLGLIAHHTSTSGDEVLKLDMSQETIAQMVGLSRETVTRMLSHLRKRGILDWNHSSLLIRNRRALANIADLPEVPTNLAGGTPLRPRRDGSLR